MFNFITKHRIEKLQLEQVTAQKEIVTCWKLYHSSTSDNDKKQYQRLLYNLNLHYQNLETELEILYMKLNASN